MAALARADGRTDDAEMMLRRRHRRVAAIGSVARPDFF
jgi:hypothetical protein